MNKTEWKPSSSRLSGLQLAVILSYQPSFIVNYHHSTSSDAISGTYNNFSRIGWAIAVSWVIVANHLGWGGLIAKFMDHPVWQPLGRLSYCAYIVHHFLIRYIFNLDERPAHYISVWRTYIHLVIPTVVVSYVIAFFWSCIFEVPIARLEKMLTRSMMFAEQKQAAELKHVASTNADKSTDKDRCVEEKPALGEGAEVNENILMNVKDSAPTLKEEQLSNKEVNGVGPGSSLNATEQEEECSFVKL
ncbi:hypothetical protein OESDEN_04484 [Oesophagostomum dentatum]|uniref:Acyltransferase 3 domain-containing protein n=1 Tax=Oesophagostomum dentatum TaxID=61180 RepID=A0A0B1TDF0_OESDE|nr:hypothetical protein OESDEN_04484 [Oesophagostomum dentatum]